MGDTDTKAQQSWKAEDFDVVLKIRSSVCGDQGWYSMWKNFVLIYLTSFCK